MIYLPKSQPAPSCLEDEKKKANGSYNCDTVVERLFNDFHNKCYICEKKAPLSINVEHFISHQGNKDLKFDWNNLFYVCAHCNNSKLTGYDDILNCTTDVYIEHRIDYFLNPIPRELPIIKAIAKDAVTKKTVELLDKIYNGHTIQKRIEAANLRRDLLKDVRHFYELLHEYDDAEVESLKEIYKLKIISELHSSSSFTAFKRYIIRKSKHFFPLFSDYTESV